MQLSDDQREQIIRRSQEAQHFMRSFLYEELAAWIAQEQAAASAMIATNKRTADTENLTRAEFVERMSAYYLALPQLTAVIKGFAMQEKELKKVDEGRSTGTGKR